MVYVQRGPPQEGDVSRAVGLLGWLGVVVALMAGCRDELSSPRIDSESHWLEQCETSETCGAFECVCGVCTVPCIDDCGLTAICAPAPEACAVPAGGLCTVSCAVDGDCVRSHLACIEGACLPIATPMTDGGVVPPDAAPDAMSPDADVEADAAAADMGPPGDIDAMPDAAAGDMSPIADMAPAMQPDLAPPIEGECAHPDSVCFDDAQCPDGVCSAALPGGPCACLLPGPAIERVECGADFCCEDADCPAVGERAGRCQAQGLDPQNQGCGNVPAANICLAESCARDVDCGDGKTCVRPGEYGHAISACVDATCATDADCVDGAEGRCTPFFTACYVRGFHCTYADDECRGDADCPQRGVPKVCLPLVDGGTECREAPPAE